MKRLFVCERQYPLYRTLIRCIHDTENDNDIVISNIVGGLEKIYPVLHESNIFTNVFFFDDTLYKEYALHDNVIREQNRFPQGIFVMFNQLRRFIILQNKAKDLQLPQDLDINQYDEIFVSDGTSSIMLYLCNHKKYFICCGHGNGVFQCEESWSVRMIRYCMPILEKLGIVYSVTGSSKWVKAIEVNDSNKKIHTTLRKKNVREVNIDKMLENMSPNDKNRIYEIYREAYGLVFDYSKPVYIVLTNPLFQDGFVASIEEHIRVYKNLIERRIGTCENVFIKPHPRDTMDYTKHFPEVQVINKGISAEILNLSSNLQIEGVYGFMTSSMSAFTTAKHKEWYSADQLKDFLSGPKNTTDNNG